MKILITGARSGIGYEVALVLAEMNHKVYLTCHTKKEALYLRKKLMDYKNIYVFKLDITSEEDRLKVLDLDIDVLINNAAVAQGGSIIEADINKVRDNFEVNIFSSFRLLQIVIRQMIEKKNGRIVVISSLAGLISIPFLGIYSATKAGIISLTSALQKELSLISSNVNAVIVEPGIYHTGFNNLFLDNKYDNGKYFKKIKNKLYKIEHFILNKSEKRNLDSVVIKIVRAVTDKKSKKVYKVPFYEALLVKIYGLFK